MIAAKDSANLSILLGSSVLIRLNASVMRIRLPAIVSRSTSALPMLRPLLNLSIAPKASMIPPRPTIPLAMVPVFILPIFFIEWAIKATPIANPIIPDTFFPEACCENADISKNRSSKPPSPFIKFPRSMLPRLFTASTRRLMAIASPKNPTVLLSLEKVPIILVNIASSPNINPKRTMPFKALSSFIAANNLIGSTRTSTAAAAFNIDPPSTSILPNSAEIPTSSAANNVRRPTPFKTSPAFILDKTTTEATITPIAAAIFKSACEMGVFPLAVI